MSALEEQFLSLEDVAERLQVSDQSVRRWIKAGKLAAYKPGLEWRIRPSDLEDFLETRSYPKVQAPLPSDDQRRAYEYGPIVQELEQLCADWDWRLERHTFDRGTLDEFIRDNKPMAELIMLGLDTEWRELKEQAKPGVELDFESVSVLWPTAKRYFLLSVEIAKEAEDQEAKERNENNVVPFPDQRGRDEQETG